MDTCSMGRLEIDVWLIMLREECIGIMSYWVDANLIYETYANGGDDIVLKYVEELASFS